MEPGLPRLTDGRRAGVLAAVAVYPLTRLAGTIPRPTLDRAIVSGTTMAVAYVSAASTMNAARGVVSGRGNSEQVIDRRAAVLTSLVAAGAGVLAWRVRARARAVAEHEERVSVAVGSVGSLAEVVTVASGAAAAVALSDTLGALLPESLRPRNPVIVVLGEVAIGAAFAAASRHPLFLHYFTLPPHEGSPPTRVEFQAGASLPLAVGRAAGVALLALGVITVETIGAEWIARGIVGHDDPGGFALVTAHSVIGLGVVAAGGAGLAFYSSRVAVQEQLLEEAYAAVPSRNGVTGGPDSAYDFADLGREGRRFISQAYTAGELTRVLGVEAVDPVRAMLPLPQQTGDPAKDAAALVAEVERVGGFGKGVIVLAAPTGDGYVSYVQTESVELLTAGDCATVTVPYAQVPSALAMPRRKAAAAAYAVYARALSTRALQLNPSTRLYAFGESLGSIVALDGFGPTLVDELRDMGFSGGVYAGVPVYSHTDRALRPRHPDTRVQAGLQYVTGRDQALKAQPGHVNLTHPTDPVALADPSSLVRHQVDYWGRPTGTHVPLVSFLVELADVKNAMNLRPGEFTPSPGHDYRYDTAAAVARAYGLDFHQEELVEQALRERELQWSVRRLLARRLGAARDSAMNQLRSWGVDPATLRQRFGGGEGEPSWIDSFVPGAGGTDASPTEGST
jgi:uncharacterized membrane protein